MPNDKCARCHHVRQDHEETLIGCQCHGVPMWVNAKCKCEEFVEGERE